ncbi:hypothetical protein M758_6G059600 [Ceratodon purpureus]|nr:hypothetical protein M758_6G059600 [Ceratodon purpureus]
MMEDSLTAMMEDSLAAMAGSLAYSSIRGAARKAIDFLDLKAPAVEGSVHNYVEAKLGTRKYERLCQDEELVLKKVCYLQRGLDLGGSVQAVRQLVRRSNFDESEQRRSLLNHDSLLLEIQHGNPNEPSTLHIVAEKLGGTPTEEETPGIHIYPCERLQDKAIDSLHDIDCGSARLSFRKILAVLEKKGSGYDLRDDNCWDYARKTTKWLLEACIEALESDGEFEEARRLQTEKAQLKLNLFECIVDNSGDIIENFIDNSGDIIENFIDNSGDMVENFIDNTGDMIANSLAEWLLE